MNDIAGYDGAVAVDNVLQAAIEMCVVPFYQGTIDQILTILVVACSSHDGSTDNQPPAR